ncbi:MAG: hypothetical protein MRZ17_04410 [Acholeplasmataceae bacterium]|nr:hypothetical protein [Acholeplasmataceae bacterium]
MYSVKIGNNTYCYEVKKTLEEIAKELGIKCYAATVNNRMRELTYYLNYDCVVEFFDLTNSEAVRVYQTTLRYVIIMALKRIRPAAKINFSDYVSRTFLGVVKDNNFKINQSFIDELNQEVKKIINANYPIVRQKLPKEEVLELYKKEGYEDKIAFLKYRQDDFVNTYECDGFINYMYGYMLPSTGYLNDYVLRLYYPGFVIQYPRAEEGGKIPAFEDDQSFSRMIQSARSWRLLCGVENISTMNQFTESRDFVKFVNMCETKHNNMLAELGLKIKENIDDIKLIAIAGPSSSGKTTFTNRLKIELMTRGINPVMISMDDYYLNREDTPLDENGDPDFESVDALDIKFFNQQLVSLIQGDEVTLPIFDFKQGKRIQGSKVKLEPHQPILIEGIHALNEKVTSLIPKHQKFKIFISPVPQLNIDDHNPICATDLRLIRRIVRDAKYRKTSPNRTFAMWKNVRRGEFKWIYQWQKEADYVFNSELTYEIMVMKKYALPALQTIKSDDEYYIQANRLIKFLKYVNDIEDKYVPCNSILREFIGDSCFYEYDE